MANKILRNAGDQTWQQALEDARKKLGMVADKQFTRPQTKKITALQRAAFGPPPPEFDPAWLLSPHPYPEYRRGLLTPELASKLGDTIGHNRKLIPGSMATFARVILQDLWHFTNQGMAVDSLGHCQDGQNRIGACVLANKPIDVAMFVGMPPDNFVHLDSGRNRTFRHVGQIHKLSNAAHLGTVVRLVLEFYQWREVLHLNFGKLKITNEEYDAEVTSPAYEHYARGAQLGGRGYYRMRSSVPAVGAAYCLFIDAGAPPAEAERFLDELTLDTAGDSSPSRRLRKHLVDKFAQRVRISAVRQLGMILKCWNATMSMEPLGNPAFPARLYEMFPISHPWIGE